MDQNVRQNKDPQYADLLGRGRLGMINMEDVQLIKTRLASGDDPNFVGACRIFPTVKKVNDYN